MLYQASKYQEYGCGTLEHVKLRDISESRKCTCSYYRCTFSFFQLRHWKARFEIYDAEFPFVLGHDCLFSFGYPRSAAKIYVMIFVWFPLHWFVKSDISIFMGSLLGLLLDIGNNFGRCETGLSHSHVSIAFVNWSASPSWVNYDNSVLRM